VLDHCAVRLELISDGWGRFDYPESADAGDAHDHLAIARREMHGLLPIRAPLPGVDRAWRHQLQRAEEAGEVRHRMVVHPRRPSRIGAEALICRVAVAASDGKHDITT